MFVASLQSGSNGNCIYVEAAGVSLLFDAGISGRQAELRLGALGRDIRDVRALIVSHDHRDHSSCAGIYQRKFGVPVRMTRRTREAADARCGLGQMTNVREFRAGQTMRFGAVRVETIPTPHDAQDGVMFVVRAEGKRLGILTDLGHVFGDLRSAMGKLDAVVLESNYDPGMLARGWYPEFLKDRIRGPGGHISNLEAAKLLAQEAAPSLKWICLAHLSEDNNSPRVALSTHRRVLGEDLDIRVSSRYEPVVMPDL
ncbi:MAG: MBL fold metallo-hydrolase [Planctomycetota bacterium]|jgi:phosphoribosyl 1,2-cyclic phosphodiesterase